MKDSGIKLVRYTNDVCYDIVCYWLAKRNVYVPTEDEMPRIGYMAHVDGNPIAAGFLRYVEGGFALLDGLVTNPDSPGEFRNIAIDAVVSRLLKKAKSAGILKVTAYTKDAGTLLRSVNHGFVSVPHTVIIADLTENTYLC